MQPVITSEVVVAYAQCPRKAYLLLFSPEQGKPHEYVQILEQRRKEKQERYIDHLQQIHADVQPYSLECLRKGSTVLINAHLQVDGFAAGCGVLTKVEEKSTFGKHSYEPAIFVGTHSVGAEQKLELSFVGYVLEQLQSISPVAGRIIRIDGTSHTVKLENSSQALVPLLEPLRDWITADSPTPPPIILNKHCPLCPFQRLCHAQAEQEDNLSLLDGVTARVMRQYEKKGIFTVKQLSYLFKPRPRKKGSRKPPAVTHKVELQALAIREKKIYLQELPAFSRQPVELFMDMEGVPERGFYYLIGLLVYQGDTTEHHAFWADTRQDEHHMWQQFLDIVTQYPDAPIYHYGSYEPRGIATLAKRYGTDIASLTKRLVNVNRYIYGKVYFPVRSNGLKDIGNFIGAKWTSPQASGLQSLVWRYHWENTHDLQYKNLLLQYNAEDCSGLERLTSKLTQIKDAAEILSDVDFAHTPKVQTSEVGQAISNQFETILKFATAKYEKRKISFRKGRVDKEGKRGGVRPSKISPKPMKVIKILQRTVCPNCGYTPLQLTEYKSIRLIIDLVLTGYGVKKTTTKYVGFQEECDQCKKKFIPPKLLEFQKHQFYGHGFKSWIIYQRVALRLPFGSIVESVKEQFNEKISSTRIPYFMKNFADYYTETEKILIKRLLEGPFIHADETTFNIQGANWYVWIFTNGKYVIFKLTETREADIAHKLLADYSGILISDFYAGYDSIPCRQQKCWVHLIRHLNNDLKENPFDIEYEHFIVNVRDLINPIMEDVQKYGLKKYHLQKFKMRVDTFYDYNILNKKYKSELALKYQEHFLRYRESLFTFLEQDGVPWHNNTAENALRHLAVQRDISKSSFHEIPTHNYLVLLSIRQTCRFQGKSFFKFLFSGKTDLDNFGSRKRQREMYLILDRQITDNS